MHTPLRIGRRYDVPTGTSIHGTDDRNLEPGRWRNKARRGGGKRAVGLHWLEEYRDDLVGPGGNWSPELSETAEKRARLYPSVAPHSKHEIRRADLRTIARFCVRVPTLTCNHPTMRATCLQAV